MSGLTLDGLAEKLSLSIFDTIRHLRSQESALWKREGVLFFKEPSAATHTFENTAEAREIEAREIPEGNQEQESQDIAWDKIKTFILDAVNTFPKKHGEGLHTVYSGFNTAFRKEFPDVDPISATEQLAAEGFLRLRLARGGRLLFVNARDPLHPSYDPAIAPPVEVLPSSYDYAAKKIWRQEWYSFLAKHVSINVATRVLCLGGFGEEIQGYEALGIQRKNIVVVERDWTRARHIAAAYQGITLYRGELADYLEEADDPFDGILLDYDGNLSDGKVAEIDAVFRRNLLKKDAVFGTNLFANRESNEVQGMYLEPYITDPLASLRGMGVDKDRVPPEVGETAETMNAVRDYGITALLLRLSMGTDVREINQSLLHALPRKETERFEQLLARHPPKNFMEYLRTNDLVRATLQTVCSEAGISPALAFVLDAFSSRPYFIQETKRVKYRTAEWNNSFYSDFIAVSKEEQLVEHILGESLVGRFMYGKETLPNLQQRLHALPSSRRDQVNGFIRRCGDAVRQAYINFFITEQTPVRTWIGDAYERKNGRVSARGR